MSFAPIVLFTYNRPWHTKKTVEALKKNMYAKESDLIIYCDGAKSIEDELKTKEVRKYTNTIKGFKSIEIKKNETNLGLANSIVRGVTEVLNKYGKIIVIEDDIITSPGFLKYMNDALLFYEKNEKVMHVSGYMFPVRGRIPETFFYNVASCWGWGTWKRAWKHLNTDAKFLYNNILSNGLTNRFNNDGAYNFIEQLEKNIRGEYKTWAVKWYASFFLENGFALHPRKSLTYNIGFDGTGANCDIRRNQSRTKLIKKIKVKPIPIVESQKARDLVSKYWASYYAPKFYERIYQKINRLLNKILSTKQ